MADKKTERLLAKRPDHQTSHVLHLLLSILTAGLWIPVWILVAMSHAGQRSRIDLQLQSTSKAGPSHQDTPAQRVTAPDSGRIHTCRVSGTSEPQYIGPASSVKRNQQLTPDRKPNGKYGPSTVLVRNANGHVIGYIPHTHDAWLAELIDNGQSPTIVAAHVSKEGSAWKKQVWVETEIRTEEGSESGRAATEDADRIPCPECAERIRPEAKRCRFCGASLVENE